MRTLRDILTFQKMISPVLLQILFWAGIGGTLYGTWVLIRLEHWAWWIALLFGLLATRVIFEVAILAFRAFDRLSEIRDHLAAMQLRGGRDRPAAKSSPQPASL